MILNDISQGITIPEELFHVHLEPSKGWAPLKVRELWDYPELFYSLTWRAVKVRYKQAAPLGATWAILQPFLTMEVFSLFFCRLAQMLSEGVLSPLFCYAALVPWTFFANSGTQSSNSLVTNVNLIKMVYFPRLVIPIAGVFGGFIDFALAFVILVGMMLAIGYAPTVNIVWLPLLFLLAVDLNLHG